MGSRNRRARRAIGAAGMAGLVFVQAACGTGGDDDTMSTSEPGDEAINLDSDSALGMEAAADDVVGPAPPGNGPNFEDYGISTEVATADDNRSTFALDVDTGSYAIARDYLNDSFMPPQAAVRTEELINYFPHDYEPPEDGMGIHLDGAAVPFLDDPSKRVIRVGLQAAVVDDNDRLPATLTFVVDTSGSMADGNMDMVRHGLERLVDSLRPEDEVGIVTFSNDADLLLDTTAVADGEPIRAAIAALEPDEMTNLEAGLRLGYRHALDNLREDGINRVILLSDGAANRGEEDPEVLAEQIARAAGDDTQLVVVGVGRNTYNDVVLEQFANQGNGFYAFIDTKEEAERLFVDNLTGTLQTVALDAKVQVTFNEEAVSHFRLLGYENREVDHDAIRDDSVDGGEVGAGHSVTALYEVTLPESGAAGGDTELATVDLHWRNPDSGDGVDTSATITAADVAGSFDQAPERLRQDILVAAFAEGLKGGPWGERVSLADVAANLAVLVADLDDTTVAELAELAQTAADLAP